VSIRCVLSGKLDSDELGAIHPSYAVQRLSDLTDELDQIGAGKSVRISLRRGSETRDVTVDIVDIGPT